jgi:hypothetical protein
MLCYGAPDLIVILANQSKDLEILEWLLVLSSSA